MCLFVHASCGRGVRRLDEAERLAGLLVHPVALVVHAVLALHGEVGLMRLGDVGRCGSFGQLLVNVHVERHGLISLVSTEPSWVPATLLNFENCCPTPDSAPLAPNGPFK